MTEMIERVALAMQGAHGVVSSRDPRFVYARYRLAARAAIEAMREPTQAMIAAAETSLDVWRKSLSRDEAMLRHYIPPPRKAHKFIASATPQEKHAIRFAAMIDAALGAEAASPADAELGPGNS